MGIYLAAASVIGAGISAYGSASSARSAAKQREAAYSRALGAIGGYRDRGAGWLANAFGSKVDPEALLYHPVDLTQSQLSTIKGNLKAAPKAIELADVTNPSIWKNDLGRIRSLMPEFDAARDSYIGTTRKLQEGRIPFDDVMDLMSTSASLTAAGSTPGGGRAVTMRDLGLSKMDAMNQGNSMFAQFVNIAQQISPVEHQMRPQDMFFRPQERAQLDIEQAALEQQGRASAAMAEAMPDPAQNALVNAEIGIEMAAMGSSYAPSSTGAVMASLGQGIQSAAMLYGDYRRSRPQYYGEGSYTQGPPAQMDGQIRPYGDYVFSDGPNGSQLYLAEPRTNSFTPTRTVY